MSKNMQASHPSSKVHRERTFDIMAKMIIIGDSGVGKTNILTRFCHNVFKDSHVATIGVDFNVKIMEVEGVKIKMQVWDTAGQERFKTITETYYKGASGIIIVYSVDNRLSFNNVRKWVEQVNQKVSSSIPKILVANKIDLYDDEQSQGGRSSKSIPHNINKTEITTQEDDGLQANQDLFSKNSQFFQQKSEKTSREVTKLEGEELARQLNMGYMEVSAKYNTQIYDIFYTVGQEIISKPGTLQDDNYSGYYRKILVGSKMDSEQQYSRVKISEHGSREGNCAC